MNHFIHSDQYHGITACNYELPPTPPAVVVLDQFSGWISINQAPANYRFYNRHLYGFGKHIGMCQPVVGILPIHVTKWVNARYADQSDMSEFATFHSVQLAFNRANEKE